MGLLDSVIGALAGDPLGNAPGTGGGQAALINIVLGMLTNRPGAEAGGGLGDVLAKFQQAGLGDAASSWVSTGQNVPVSPDQVEGTLGTDLIAQIARQIGLPHAETAGRLSELLPQVVDRMTPGGQLPEGGVNADELAGFEGLGDLLRRFS